MWLRNLQTRLLWQVDLPHYGLERVTWMHVFGLRRFETPVPLRIQGWEVEPHCCGSRYRFWWYVA